MRTTLLITLLLLSQSVFAALKDYDFISNAEQIVALTLLGEARGEGKQGVYAVACVIQERSINRKLPMHMVCIQHKQFSCWNDKAVVDLLHLFDDSKQMYYAIDLARAMSINMKLDRTYVNNANHFCTLKANPYWAKGKKPVKIIGNHKFYKLK